MRFSSELQMAEAVARHFKKKSTSQLRVGKCILDVVAYDEKQNLFRIVECKLHSHVTGIGHAFGQISAYYGAISAMGREFITAFTNPRKVPLNADRIDKATGGFHRMRIAFYVALTDKACDKQIGLIRSMKHLLPKVGIIRVKDNGICRGYLRQNGKKDSRIAQAIPTVVEILPKRPQAKWIR